jgi:hypothetical protein
MGAEYRLNNGPRAVPGSQRPRTHDDDQINLSLPVQPDVPRAQDGSQSGAGLAIRPLTIMPSSCPLTRSLSWCSRQFIHLVLFFILYSIAFAQSLALRGATNSIPTLDQALAAREDLWGLAAMAQTNGPNYEFFARLLPPLRYVNAAFHYYPIVLSAPGSAQKARLISNGSAINAKAGLKTWKDSGTPVTFSVGESNELFGANFRHLCGPKYQSGCLPIVQLTYEHSGSVYQQETFASVEPTFASNGVVFTSFTLTSKKKPGVISARIDHPTPLTENRGAVWDTNGQALVWFSEQWKWDPAKQRLVAHLTVNQSATLAIAARPVPQPAEIRMLSAVFEKQREKCVNAWHARLDSGIRIETPEPLVNDAWRSVVVGSYMMLKGDSMNYSFGNAYERLYQAECGDITRALALFGYTDDASRMIPPLLNYTRDGLKFHNAGFKLQTLAHYYWLTRDAQFIEAVRTNWTAEINKIVDGREKESGLFPREQYCGDIFTKVYSLHSAGAAWRGLRDFATVLEELRPSRADNQRVENHVANIFSPAELLKIAAEFRQAIFTAAEKSEFTNTHPPFIPVALFGEEKPYDPLTASMRGSYWDLIAPYMLGSGMFGPGSARERAILDYLQEHGGVCMGLIRFHQHSGLFANEDGIDDLYGLRYTVKLLQLDEVDRALVSFYGKLAQGLTRDTFIGAEGTGLRPLDEFGRPMYLPPNRASSAMFLWTLRYLLIQDWDMDDDGQPETLRLSFATPKSWLENGKTINVSHAPTAFGALAFSLTSKLDKGEVLAELDLPARNPAKHTFLRVRLPDGWRTVSAKSGSNSFSVDDRGTIDISTLKGKSILRVSVQRL